MKLSLKSAALALALVPASLAADHHLGDRLRATPAPNFTVKHLMISEVNGEFGKTEGTVVLDEKDLTKSTVEATIDATTINTREPKRDAHLKSPDFFDVAKFPTITFKSTKVEKAGEGKFKVTGDLTMHGVTKPVVLDVERPQRDQGPVGQRSSAAPGHHQAQPQGLRPEVEQGHGGRRRGGR